MSTNRWLRISSVISLLYAAGHTLGGRKSWSPMGDTPVLAAMRDDHFNIGSASRSYLDFYLGFGYTIAVFQVLLAVTLWQLSTMTAANPVRARPMIAAIAVATAVCAGIAYVLILPLPAMFSLALTGSLGMAYFVPRRAGPLSAT